MMVPPDVNFVNAIISSSDSADRTYLNEYRGIFDSYGKR